MDDGERHVESLGDLADDEQPARPRGRSGRPRRAAKKGSRAGRSSPSAAADAPEVEPSISPFERQPPSATDADTGGHEEQADDGPSGAPPARRRRSARVGPKQALEQLIDAHYFDEPRTIGQIIEHLQHRRALAFAQTDVSPALTRLVREQKLERDRNAENQYQYRRPQ